MRLTYFTRDACKLARRTEVEPLVNDVRQPALTAWIVGDLDYPPPDFLNGLLASCTRR